MKKVMISLLLLGVLVLSSCAQKPEDLFSAIKDGDLDKVRNMVDLNKDLVNARKDNGETPLHEATYQGNLEIINALVQRGAEIDAKKTGGFTPLHIAAQRGHEDVVDYLLKNRANPSSKDEYGMTPGDVAERAGHKSIASRLKSADRRSP